MDRMENRIIECKIIYPLYSAITQAIFMIIGTFLTIDLAKIFNNMIVFCIGFLIFFIIPTFYNKPIKNYFTKRAIFRFGENGFIIEILDLKNSTLEKTVNYLYCEIIGCTSSTKQSNYSAITLLLNDNKKTSYTFIDNDDLDSGKVIYNQIIFESEKNPTNPKIKLIPHFYTSKLGTRLIIALVVALVLFITYQLFYDKKGLPISIASTIALVILILLKRKANTTNH
ncbi:MAG TPA: hypothetical protein VK668_18570 [Mucilaginibacter sp.]|nr:hypothetical protein [Mucilaginibacter sp.]